MNGSSKYKVLEDSKQIRGNIWSIINNQNIIGFSITSDSLAVSYNGYNYVYVFDNKIKDDILLLINSENIKKVVFSKKNTFEIINNLFDNISCNSFIDLYKLAEENNRIDELYKIKEDLDYELSKIEDNDYLKGEFQKNDEKLALEAFYALSSYEEINIITPSFSSVISVPVEPPTEIPKFNSFCLFSILNVINNELSKGEGKKAENKLLRTLSEENLPLCDNTEILNYLISNNILTKQGKIIKITENK